MAGTRIERDSMGAVSVPAERYWGAQTERSRENFRIGGERMPLPLIRALALQKKAAALANIALGAARPPARRGDRRRGAAGDRRQARRRVPARRVADRIGHADQHEHERGDRQPRQRGARRQARRPGPRSSQRSRQSRPILERQLPDRDAHRRRARDPRPPAAGAAKTSRARSTPRRANSPASSRSAAPISRTRRRCRLRAEFGAYRRQIELGIARIEACLPRLYPLAQGGTAVGTGLNAPQGFADALHRRAQRSSPDCRSSRRKTSSRRLAAHDALVELSGALNVHRRVAA